MNGRKSRSWISEFRNFRWIHLAPILASIALISWAFASPIGAGPDDDFHLVSTWCALGGNSECQVGADSQHRVVDTEITRVSCFGQKPNVSAECQSENWGSHQTEVTSRGNFVGEYPPVFYSVMHLFAGQDVQVSALVMRILNVILFVGLNTLLYILLPTNRKRTLLWGWLISMVPLGIFLIPSNNPSGWAITGVGVSFLASLGWFEAIGRSKWMLGIIYLIGIIMAAGSRGDAAIYAIGATLVAAILTYSSSRAWWLSSILPVVGVIAAFLLFLRAGQAGVAVIGFTSSSAGETSSTGPSAGLSEIALAAYNLLLLPYLLSGVWGTWALGWLDTRLPYLVPLLAFGTFVVVSYLGLRKIDWRKLIALVGVALVLIVLPVYVLTKSNAIVGQALQSRYLLPLIVLFALILVTVPKKAEIGLSKLIGVIVLGALAIANLVALQVNIRRYVTGANQQGLNLDAGAQWWWTGFPVGPIWIWIIGAIAFAGMLAVLFPSLTNSTRALRTRVEPVSNQVEST